MKILKRKNLWIMSVIMVCFFCISIHANAQNQDRQLKMAEERAKMITDKMKEKLQLNDTQYKSMYAVNLKYVQKNQQQLNELKAAREKLIKDLKSSLVAKDGEVKNVLNSDQYTKYEQQKAKIKKHMRHIAKNKRKHFRYR